MLFIRYYQIYEQLVFLPYPAFNGTNGVKFDVDDVKFLTT